MCGDWSLPDMDKGTCGLDQKDCIYIFPRCHDCAKKKHRLKAESIRLVYLGEYLSYYEIKYVDMITGKVKYYEMVSKQGSRYSNTVPLNLNSIGEKVKAVVLVVFNEDHSKILLGKEFRLGINDYIFNNIAGLIEPGETIEEAAKRELKEETGLDLIKIINCLRPSYTCAPVTDELTQLIICEAKGEIKKSDNPMEEIEPYWCDKEEVKFILNSINKISGRTQAILYSWVYGF